VLSPSEDEWEEDYSQADFWGSVEAAVDAAAAEEATAAECLPLQARSAVPTERRYREDAGAAAALEGLRRAGLLPGGQGGRGELETGGMPLSFDPGK
jgi:hypothetical protein